MDREYMPTFPAVSEERMRQWSEDLEASKASLEAALRSGEATLLHLMAEHYASLRVTTPGERRALVLDDIAVLASFWAKRERSPGPPPIDFVRDVAELAASKGYSVRGLAIALAREVGREDE